MQYFRKPKNLGPMKDADAVGQVGNMVCGDVMKIYLKIKDKVITKATFETFGCVWCDCIKLDIDGNDQGQDD